MVEREWLEREWLEREWLKRERLGWTQGLGKGVGGKDGGRDGAQRVRRAARRGIQPACAWTWLARQQAGACRLPAERLPLRCAVLRRAHCAT